MGADSTNPEAVKRHRPKKPGLNPACEGERLGSVHHLMINKYTGQVAYAKLLMR
jgi:hypothetical protein